MFLLLVLLLVIATALWGFCFSLRYSWRVEGHMPNDTRHATLTQSGDYDKPRAPRARSFNQFKSVANQFEFQASKPSPPRGWRTITTINHWKPLEQRQRKVGGYLTLSRASKLAFNDCISTIFNGCTLIGNAMLT